MQVHFFWLRLARLNEICRLLPEQTERIAHCRHQTTLRKAAFVRNWC